MREAARYGANVLWEDSTRGMGMFIFQSGKKCVGACGVCDARSLWGLLGILET